MSAAVKILEHIHKLLGLSAESQAKFTSETAPQSTPAPDIVRQRITKLMQDKKIQQEADQAGIDLNSLKDLADKS